MCVCVCHKFLKVLYIVPSYSRYTRALTFETLRSTDVLLVYSRNALTLETLCVKSCSTPTTVALSTAAKSCLSPWGSKILKSLFF